ncbi:MAG TPA: gephyrin-like molybdotransferase Glp [Pseudonocardiaceae bacterium]
MTSAHTLPKSHSLSVLEHRAFVDALTTRLPPVRRPLLAEHGSDRCLGAVLAENVVTRMPVPPFTNSAMDGFVVRHADIADATGDSPTTLPVAGDIPAGDTTPHELRPGTAWRIMTGAPIPFGADTVVKVEQTDHTPGTRELPHQASFYAAPAPGANIRRAGEDVRAGLTVLAAGCRLDATALACAASVGYGDLAVYPQPRVGIVTAGDELVAPGVGPRPGKVPDSNGVLLTALAEAAGARVVARARVRDDPRALRAALDGWSGIDLVITAGGISAGAYEVVRQALSRSTMRFHHVAQEPGGPQGVGTIRLGGRDVPVLCLPGNPVAVFVGFHVYAAGMIEMMAGRRTGTQPPTHEVIAAEGWSSSPTKTQFIPLCETARGTVRRIHRLGPASHLVASLPLADGLGVVPAGIDHVDRGDCLRFIPTHLESR